MKNKNLRTLLLLVVVVLVILAVYFFREYNRKAPDTAERKADYSLKADQVIAAFSTDEKASNAKYLDKVLEVSGNVKSIDKDDKGLFTISLGDAASMSSVRCSMDSTHNLEAESLKQGSYIVVKGVCTGFNSDELLGSDILLSRSAIIQKK